MNMNEYNKVITEKVIEALEKGVAPWRKPWVTFGNQCPDPRRVAVSYTSGECYSMSNQWSIMIAGLRSKHLGPGEYATFKTIKENGGKVKKGMHGATVYFFKTLAPVPVKDKNGNIQIDDAGHVIQFVPWVARAYTVFNIYTQCEGIAPKWLDRAVEAEKNAAAAGPSAGASDIPAARDMVNAYMAREHIVLTHGGESAFYAPLVDSITLPLFESFKDPAAYYLTAFHEMTHSTGHQKRLNRLAKHPSYAREELVAEIGASTLCAYMGIDPQIDDAAAYCKAWLARLKDDAGAVPFAARHALKACDSIVDGPVANEHGETDAA